MSQVRFVGDNWLQKRAGYDFTNCFRSAAKKIQLNTVQKWGVKLVRPVKESDNSVTVQPRLTKCCTYIRAHLLCSHTGYDIISYFRSAFIEVRKTPPMAAFDRILVVRRSACLTNGWASCA